MCQPAVWTDHSLVDLKLAMERWKVVGVKFPVEVGEAWISRLPVMRWRHPWAQADGGTANVPWKIFWCLVGLQVAIASAMRAVDSTVDRAICLLLCFYRFFFCLPNSTWARSSRIFTLGVSLGWFGFATKLARTFSEKRISHAWSTKWSLFVKTF